MSKKLQFLLFLFILSFNYFHIYDISDAQEQNKADNSATSSNGTKEKQSSDTRSGIIGSGSFSTSFDSASLPTGSGNIGYLFVSPKDDFVSALIIMGFGTAQKIKSTNISDFSRTVLVPCSGIPSIYIECEWHIGHFIKKDSPHFADHFGLFFIASASSNSWTYISSTEESATQSIIPLMGVAGLTYSVFDATASKQSDGTTNKNPDNNKGLNFFQVGLQLGYNCRYISGDGAYNKDFLQKTLGTDQKFYQGFFCGLYLDYHQKKLFIDLSYLYNKTNYVPGLTGWQIYTGITVYSELATVD
jgi:hypothetical protein